MSMPRRASTIISCILLLTCLIICSASDLSQTSLPDLNSTPVHAKTTQEALLEGFRSSQGVTVSGLSSGAFFTVQLSIAYSRLISGFATLAGGVFNAGQGNVAMAVAVMENPSLVNLPLIYGQMLTLASTGMIDPVQYVEHQRAFIFTGSQDSTVHPGHALLLQEMYTHLGVPSSSLQLVHTIPSQHAFVTDNPSHNPCDYKGEPYINYCGYSTLRHVLNHVYPQTAPPSSLVNSTRLHAIDQYAFIPPAYSPWSSQLGIHRRGFVYIPPQCESSFITSDLFSLVRFNERRVNDTQNNPQAQHEFDLLRQAIWRNSVLEEYLSHHNGTNHTYDGTQDRLISDQFHTPQQPPLDGNDNGLFYRLDNLGHGNHTDQCKVHLAFHGCKQTQEHLGQDYIFQTGYLNYADTNDMVIIFPQAAQTVLNPNGCFDWWGYSGLNYSTKYGAQPMTYMHLATSMKALLLH